MLEVMEISKRLRLEEEEREKEAEVEEVSQRLRSTRKRKAENGGSVTPEEKKRIVRPAARRKRTNVRSNKESLAMARKPAQKRKLESANGGKNPNYFFLHSLHWLKTVS